MMPKYNEWDAILNDEDIAEALAKNEEKLKDIKKRIRELRNEQLRREQGGERRETMG